MCLICGELLCSQTYCCQKEIFKKRVGCCTAHAYKCSGSVGVFLRVSECQVLLMHLNMNSPDDMQVRGSFVAAPYLDDYGETDQGLKYISFKQNIFPLHLLIFFYFSDAEIHFICVKLDIINYIKTGYHMQYPKKSLDHFKIKQTY